MSDPQQDRSYPAGRPPWDTWNGLRVGLLAGGITGVAISALAELGSYWLVLPTAAIGGAIGYWSQKRKLDRDQV